MTTDSTPRGAKGGSPLDAVARQHLSGGPYRLAVVAMSRDDNPKATVMVLPEGGDRPMLAVKVGLTPGAALSVRSEAQALRRLQELDPSRRGGTVPRLVELRDDREGTWMVTTVCPGRSLAMDYHQWRHTGRRHMVASDFSCVAEWLSRSASSLCPPSQQPAWDRLIAGRWPEDEIGPRAAAVAARLHQRLALPTDLADALVHGDFWCGNVLRSGGRVRGVVDWEHAVFGGDPIRDRVRFALAYSLYLDRHTRPGRLVHGHFGLRGGMWGDPIRYVMRGMGWYAQMVAAFVGDGLAATGRPRWAWRDALLLGLAEIAALTDEGEFAGAHARLLVELGDDWVG